MNVEKMAFRTALVLVPMFLWLFLYLSKRSDQRFLTQCERCFLPVRWILWIGVAILFAIGSGGDKNSFFLGLLLLICYSIGLGIVHHWVKKRIGSYDPEPQEDWWPAKKD